MTAVSVILIFCICLIVELLELINVHVYDKMFSDTT